MNGSTITPVDEVPKEVHRSPGALGAYIAESNFDELTPEQQEYVRIRFARLFISVLEHE